MHWQIARYYLPTQDLWVLYNAGPNKRVEHIRRDLLLEMRNTSRPSSFRFCGNVEFCG